jgi:hypothetical protein
MIKEIGTIQEMSEKDYVELKRRLISQINDMNAAELESAAKAHGSLLQYVAKAAKDIAMVLGYLVALPVAWVTKLMEESVKGFGEGFKAAFKSVGY